MLHTNLDSASRPAGNETHPIGQRLPNAWGLYRYAGECLGVASGLI
jgi:hypothetical protein